MFRVDRQRMRALCTEGLNIQHGKSFVSLVCGEGSDGVTAHFEDGTIAKGDLVVGAEGAQSVVREQLLGKEKSANTASEFINMMAIVNYDDVEKTKHVRTADEIFAMAYHPEGLFSFIAGNNHHSHDRAQY